MPGRCFHAIGAGGDLLVRAETRAGRAGRDVGQGACCWGSVGRSASCTRSCEGRAVRALRRGVAAVAGVFMAGAGLFAGAGAAVAAPNLIVNGSFEAPNVPAGSFGIFPTIPGWSHQPRPGTTSSGIE